jgi:hypothetical protein
MWRWLFDWRRAAPERRVLRGRSALACREQHVPHLKSHLRIEDFGLGEAF